MEKRKQTAEQPLAGCVFALPPPSWVECAPTPIVMFSCASFAKGCYCFGLGQFESHQWLVAKLSSASQRDLVLAIKFERQQSSGFFGEVVFLQICGSAGVSCLHFWPSFNSAALRLPIRLLLRPNF